MSLSLTLNLGKSPGTGCAELLRLATICVQTDPQSCATCFDPMTFHTAFLQETTQEFQKTNISASPFDPTFCDVANQKVCDNYMSTQSCCCQEGTAAYRQCLFNEVLVPSVGLSSVQCSDTCSQKVGGEGSSRGAGTGAIIGIIVALVIVVGIVCSIYIYRRRNRVGDDLPTTRTEDNKKSILASFGLKMPKRRASEMKVDEETSAPPSISSYDSSSSSSDSSSSSSSSDDSSASSSDDLTVSSAAFRPKEVKPIPANNPAAHIQSFGGESSISSRDVSSKRIPSLKKAALNKAEQQGSQRSVPSFTSTDNSLVEGPQPPKRKSAKEPTSTSDRDISGSLNADKTQGGSPQQKGFKSYASNDESKSGGGSNERKSQEASIQSSDDSERQEIVKELTGQMHELIAELQVRDDALSREDALKKAKRQGSQRSVPSFTSTDSSLKGPQQKSAKEPLPTLDREISGSLNADRFQAGSQQNSFKSYVSNDESKSGGRSNERKRQEASIRSSDDSGRQEIVKELTSRMHEFEAQTFALKLENNSASKKLNELEKDREETNLRLFQLEEAKVRYYEKRARYAEAKADALRKSQEIDAKIIAELQVKNDALRSKSEELPLEEGESNSSLSKESKAPKSRLPKSGGHKLENLAGSFNESWTHERVQAFEKWELKIKRAPGLC